jgi:hypothetical protein
MLYEKKRTFGREPIDLASAAFAVGAQVYVGQAISTVASTAETLDFEADNQHFPDENTLEVFGWENAASAAKGATVLVKLQSSRTGENWADEVSFALNESEIIKDKLIRRFTIPSNTMRHMRLLMQVGTEVFTSGKILAFVRPL